MKQIHAALAVAASAVALLSVRTSLGQTWNGGGGDNNYTTAANWSGGVAPTNNGTANINFAGSVRTSPFLPSSQNVLMATFSSASAFNITGAATTSLTVAATGANNGINVTGNGGVTFNENVTIAGNATVAATGSSLTFNRGVHFGSGATVTLAPAAGRAETFNGNYTFAANGTVICDGAGTINFNTGVVAYSGTASVTMYSGTINDGAFLPNISVYGATLNMTTSAQQDDMTIGSGMVNPSASGTNFSDISISGGSIGSAPGVGVMRMTGTLTQNGTSTAVINSTFNNAGGAAIVVRGSVQTFMGNLNLNGGLTGADTTVSVNALLGTLTINSPAGISTMNKLTIDTFGSGAIKLEGTQPVAPGGTVAFTGGGSLNRTIDAGPIQARLEVMDDTNFRINSPVPIAFDTFGLSNSVVSNFGTLNTTNPTVASVIHSAATLTNTGSMNVPHLTNYGILINAGTLASSALLNIGSFVQSGTLVGTVTNSGNLVVTAGTATLTGQLIISPGGTLDYSGAGALHITGNLTANGDLRLLANSTVGNALNITNNATFDLNGSLLQLGTLSGTLVNNGTVTGDGSFDGYLVTNNGQWTVPHGFTLIDGSFINAGGALMLPAGATFHAPANTGFVNSGAVALSGATLMGTTANGDGAELENEVAGQIAGYGRITLPIDDQFGLILPQGGLLTITQPFYNAGTIRPSLGGSLGGGGVTNGGLITGDGVITSPITNAAGGRVQPMGTLSLTAPLSNAVGGLVQLPAGSLLSLSQGFAGRSNAGQIVLAGGNLDTGGTALTNAGTGQITGYGNVTTGGLRNSGTVTLTGGTTFINGPVTNDAGKAFKILYNPVIFTGFVTNNGNLTVIGTSVTFTGGSSGAGPSPVPNAVGGSGATVITAGSAVTSDGITQGSLIIQGGGLLTLATREPSGGTPATGRAVGQSISVLGSLEVDPGGMLDVQDNDVMVHGGSAGAEAAIRALIASHAVYSSLAGGGGGDALAAVGELLNADGMGGALYTTFDGVAAVSTDVLVKYTYAGDTDLNGRVDANDLANLVAGMGGRLSGWVNGDVNYDGVVNGTDFGLLMASLRGQGGAFGDATDPGGSVPEPWMGLAVAGLVLRRGRRGGSAMRSTKGG